MTSDSTPISRPPVGLGCATAVAAVALFALVGFFFLTYVDSGADRGEFVLLDAGAYDPGHLEYVGEGNFHFIRLPGGEFLALSDLDAANRASPGRRCRAARIPSTDPALAGLVEQYESRFSPAAAGFPVVFRETCNGALYDLTGTRLDADGPNLDRLEVGLTETGRVVVRTRERECTRREGAVLRQEETCS